MKDTAANRRLLTVLVLLGVSWVLFFQPASHWSAAIQISSVKIAFSLQSDTVRFRTPVSGSGHSLFLLQIGSQRS